jgi:hypothetical protein
MRALSFAVIATLAIPSVAYSQDSGVNDGPVNSRVGSDLGLSSPLQPSLSAGRPYGPPPSLGTRAGFAGATTPGQVVPRDVPVMPRPGGQGTAFVNGHRVLVDPNSNRILRVIR